VDWPHREELSSIKPSRAQVASQLLSMAASTRLPFAFFGSMSEIGIYRQPCLLFVPINIPSQQAVSPVTDQLAACMV